MNPAKLFKILHLKWNSTKRDARMVGSNEPVRSRADVHPDEDCLEIAKFIELGTPLSDGFLERIIPGKRRPPFLSRKRILVDHISALESEFKGSQRILHVHASLIVAIRRGINLDQSMGQFRELWNKNSSCLLKNLSLRWLVSAADTFADYPQDELERSVALTTSLFVNTIKLTETERHIEGAGRKINPVNSTRGVMLFDGLTAFRVKKGDMISNLLGRMDLLYGATHPCGPILRESIARIKRGPSTYSRIFQLRKLKTDLNL